MHTTFSPKILDHTSVPPNLLVAGGAYENKIPGSTLVFSQIMAFLYHAVMLLDKVNERMEVYRPGARPRK